MKAAARSAITPSVPLLSQRALNRALLDRQLLLRRDPMPALQAVEALVGLQAQIPANPYVALWSRLVDFDPADLSGLLERREAVRANVMRATIHLVSTADYPAFRLIGAEAIARDVFRNATYGRERLAGVDMEAILAAGRAWVEERPLTGAELRARFAERWPEHDSAALAYATRALLPIVQATPRGLWGKSGLPRLTTFEAWTRTSAGPQVIQLDETPRSTPDELLEAIVLRYLRAFGPASVADAQAWSGATGLRAVFERLRPGFLVFRDERGRELFDVPDAPRPDPDTPAPPRFLPEYDNLLLAHANRTRVMAEGYRERLFNFDRVRGALLVDGFVAGAWRLAGVSPRPADLPTELEIEPFSRLPGVDRSAVEREGWALLGFLAPSSAARSIRFVE